LHFVEMLSSRFRSRLVKTARRIVFRVTVALVVCGAVVVALLLINADAGFVGATVTYYPIGWLAPLLAGAVLGAATWILLDEPRSRRNDDTRQDAGACPQCSREILGQWRMCPYCGALLGEQSRTRPETPKVTGS